MDTLRYHLELAGWHYRDRKRKLRFQLEMRALALMVWARRRWPSLEEDQ